MMRCNASKPAWGSSCGIAMLGAKGDAAESREALRLLGDEAFARGLSATVRMKHLPWVRRVTVDRTARAIPLLQSLNPTPLPRSLSTVAEHLQRIDIASSTWACAVMRLRWTATELER